MEWHDLSKGSGIRPMNEPHALEFISFIVQRKLNEGFEVVGDIRVEFYVELSGVATPMDMSFPRSCWHVKMEIEPLDPLDPCAPVQLVEPSMFKLIDLGVVRELPNAGIVR